MRVLIAPDSFDGTLSAVEAADAIASGWSRCSPDDELMIRPMSNGGTGFVDVVHRAVGGTPLAVTASGPTGVPEPATVLVVGATGYVEAAQACHPTTSTGLDPRTASTYGVGELVRAAVEAGAVRVVVGLADVGTNDGGAGLLAALGATATPADALLGGPAALARLESVDLSEPRRLLEGVQLVAGTDVETALLGLRGTTSVHGPDRGIDPIDAPQVDGWLARLAGLTDGATADRRGAGAGGGLGFGLMVLGAEATDGFDLAAGLVGLPQAARTSDLVVTGEGAFDFRSRAGTVPAGVAAIAGAAVRPCVVLAGQVLIGAREMRALGIEAAYAMDDLVGRDQMIEAPAASLARLAERVARTWSPSWRP